MRADCLMKPVHCCSVDDSLNDAARLMWEHACGAVPVVDGDGRLAGLLTSRDVAMAAYTSGRPLKDISVGSAMAKRVFACGACNTPEVARRIMEQEQVRRVPVVDREGRPVGMISTGDLTRRPDAIQRVDGRPPAGPEASPLAQQALPGEIHHSPALSLRRGGHAHEHG